MRISRRKLQLIIAGTVIGGLFFGCAKAPDAELAAAKQAIQAAKDAEADKFMVNNFLNLQNAMNSAEEDIAAQNKKMPFSRKYKNVIEKLGKITSLANEVTADAPKIKSEAIAQVKANLDKVTGMLQQTAADIKKSEKKTDKNVIAELKAELVLADTAAAKAAANFNAGDVMSAKKNLAEVQRLMSKIVETLKPKTEEPM